MDDSEAREKTTEIVYDVDRLTYLNVAHQSYNNITDYAHVDMRNKIFDFVTLSIPSAIEGVTNE